ncbi:unnamed protein product, partial [Polarella glacialis]
ATLGSERLRRVLKLLLRRMFQIFAPDVFLRQLAALASMIALRQLLWYARRCLRSVFRSRLFLAVSLSDKARRKNELRDRRRRCTDYVSFQRVGEKLDKEEGLDQWKCDDDSPYFDGQRLRDRTQKYRDLMAAGDVEGCMYALRGELLRKHFGICNPALFDVCATGTKVVVEQYIATVCEAMTWVAFTYNDGPHALDEPAKKAAIAEKLAFFSETKHGFGRSALLLSGGASVGMYHFGVVKALQLNGLMPRIISGTSAGSIVCGVLGVRTDQELMEIWNDDEFQWEKIFRLDFYGGKDFWRFLSRGGEALYSSDHLGEVLKSNIGDYTFLDAFDRTGRIINITVSGLPGNTRYPMLLNYLTSPHVLVWSAVLCSASVPGIFESRELMAKDRFGKWCPTWPEASSGGTVPCRTTCPCLGCRSSST